MQGAASAWASGAPSLSGACSILPVIDRNISKLQFVAQELYSFQSACTDAASTQTCAFLTHPSTTIPIDYQ